MAKVVNTFYNGGKMNKDLDDRLLPNGQYRNAINAQISRSEGSNVGTLQNTLGNELLTNFSTAIIESGTILTSYITTNTSDATNNSYGSVTPTQTGSGTGAKFSVTVSGQAVTSVKQIGGSMLNYLVGDQFTIPASTIGGSTDVVLTLTASIFPSLKTIGYFSDEINNRIFVFATDNVQNTAYTSTGVGSNHSILCYNISTDTTNILCSGAFLNLCQLNPITGVNVLEEFLFFTDDRNQPRKLNINNALSDSSYYTTEDQISVAKYNPYQAIELYREASDEVDQYETTMYDVTSKIFPDGGTGNINGTVSPASNTIDLNARTVSGSIKADDTIAYIDPTTGALVTTNVLVGSFDYSHNTGSNPPLARVVLKSSATLAFTDADVELVFNYNEYYDSDYNGDKDYLKDRFVRFSYRFKFLDGEYSIFAPFTQECFIPKQDGYFRYLVNEAGGTAVPSDVTDEEDAYRSTIVDFMENKINKILLRIPLEFNSSSISNSLNVESIDILYKESDGLNVSVIETIPISVVTNQNPRALVAAATTSSNTVTVQGIKSGVISPGAIVIGASITNSPRVVSFASTGIDTGVVTLTSVQSLALNEILDFGNTSLFDYEYQSTKPYKVLPSNDLLRTYDKVPVKALAQEIISNRVVYANFQDKHTPPESLNYNVAVSAKSDFNLGTGSTAINATEAIGQTVLDVDQPLGVFNNGAIVTSPEPGIPTGTVLIGYDSSSSPQTITISNALTAQLDPGDVINFQAPSNVGNTTSKIEYPSSSLKQNRNYQVGVVLSDRYGRQSTVILSNKETSTKFNDENYSGSTIFTDYIADTVSQVSWPGNSLKVLFNEAIPSVGPGIYNGDASSDDYNPLGWYSYKIVVKQTEQEYYNVYLPGVMAAYPSSDTKELGKTSHAVLINDNINKVPRDLTEVGPQQRLFRSSVQLNGRVNNLNSSNQYENNTQYYPSSQSATVSAIATDEDLFNGIPRVGYVGSSEFYNIESDPLIARINTPGGQIGIPAAITTGPISSNTTNATLASTVNILLTDLNPTVDFGAGIDPSFTLVAGQEVSGEGVNAGTVVDSIVTGGGSPPPANHVRVIFNQDLAAKNTGTVLTFSPTQPGAVSATPPQGFLNMPQLAVLETDPVESLLDIFWETTTSGLVKDLNDAILNSTNSTVQITDFDPAPFNENLNIGSSILSGNFTLKDIFGNTVTYADTSPAQLTLESVVNGNGDLVFGEGVSNPFFTFVTNAPSGGATTATYNINTAVFFYFHAREDFNKFTFTFATNVNGSQTTIVKENVTLKNTAPSIVSGCPVGTVNWTASDGNFIARPVAVNGSAAYNNIGGGQESRQDLSWSLTSNPGGYFVINQTGTGATLAGVVEFSNFSSTVPDGNYNIVATATDAGFLTATCAITVNINNSACIEWTITMPNNGTNYALSYTGCDGEPQLTNLTGNGQAVSLCSLSQPSDINGVAWVNAGPC